MKTKLVSLKAWWGMGNGCWSFEDSIIYFMVKTNIALSDIFMNQFCALF